MDILLCPESVRKSVMIKELVQGQEAATKLKVLLENRFGADGSSLSSQELVANVLGSFTQALSIVTCSSPPGGGEDYQNLLLNSGENGSPVVASGNDPQSGDSTTESRKRSLPAKKGGRGCYKRRKSAQTWTTVSCTTDDNHAWRKYGQKEILNSESPRSYFRCTHKYDQGCSAVKQVQRAQENPDMYQTTYIGIHTCKATPKATTHLVTDHASTSWESVFLVNSDQQGHHIGSPSLTIKQEYPKKDTPSDATDCKPSIMPLKVESDTADAVYSSTCSQHLALDFGVEYVHGFSTFDESQFASML